MNHKIDLTPEEIDIIKNHGPLVMFFTGCHLARFWIIKNNIEEAIQVNDVSKLKDTVERMELYVHSISNLIYGDNYNDKSIKDET